MKGLESLWSEQNVKKSEGRREASVYGHELGETYAKMTFSRLTKEGHEHAKAVVTDCYYFQFSGQGQKSTPCMTLRGLQRLLLILGGTNPAAAILAHSSVAS